ncbi:MAG: DUF1573 domain-containing protein [Eubacteriales bacterium]
MTQTNDKFQETVDSMLIQHQSILDILSKCQETSARTNRAVVKAVTNCGCLSINAHKQVIPEDATLTNLKDILDSHLTGTLCESCREVIETELGKQLFYLAALSNTLGLSLNDIINKENGKLNTLTVYNLR